MCYDASYKLSLILLGRPHYWIVAQIKKSLLFWNISTYSKIVLGSSLITCTSRESGFRLRTTSLHGVPRQFVYRHFVYRHFVYRHLVYYCISAYRTVIHPPSVSANHYFHQFQLLLTI